MTKRRPNAPEPMTGIWDGDAWKWVRTSSHPDPAALPLPTVRDGLCQCGCGGATTIARWSDARNGQIRGAPKRYIAGHYIPSARPRKNEIRPCPVDPTAVEIALSGGRLVAVVDADVAEAVAALYWTPDVLPKGTYARACENGGRIKLHRFPWRLWGGQETRYIDHKDRDGLNNRRSNLRAATPSQNASNRKPTQSAEVKTSRFKGVSRKRGKKWTAMIGVNGKYIHLGTFEREEDAAAAYRAAAEKYHGEFARTEW